MHPSIGVPQRCETWVNCASLVARNSLIDIWQRNIAKINLLLSTLYNDLTLYLAAIFCWNLLVWLLLQKIISSDETIKMVIFVLLTYYLCMFNFYVIIFCLSGNSVQILLLWFWPPRCGILHFCWLFMMENLQLRYAFYLRNIKIIRILNSKSNLNFKLKYLQRSDHTHKVII